MRASQLEASIQKVRDRLKRVDPFLAAALLISVVAAWPLLSEPGFLNTRGGGDSPFLLQRVQQLSAALADGHFPVRWMADAGYGYGYPFFNYYAPFSIYLSAALNFLGLGLVWAIKLTQLMGFLVAAWAMFSLGRRWIGSSWAGLLASATYTLAPFHMVNIYVRGDSLAEFWAMAFYPIVILVADALARAAASRDSKNIVRLAVLFGLSYAALITSHNISALIFTPFLFLYILLVIAVQGNTGSAENSRTRSRSAILLWSSAALISGLVLSAWFWLPALTEQSLAQLDPVTSGYFHFENHFRGGDLLQTTFAFDYDAAGGKAFSMGLIQVVLTLTGLATIIVFAWKAKTKEPAPDAEGARIPAASVLFIVISLVIATLMITALSRPLWENLPLLGFTQFPWRFLSVQAFVAALATAGLALLPGRRIFVPLIVILMLISSLVNLKLDFLDIGDEDVTVAALAQYEWFSGNIGSTVSAEYLPASVAPRPFTSSWLNGDGRNGVQILAGEVVGADLLSRRTTRQKWAIETASPQTQIAFPTYYWSGWKAEIDGESVDIWPAPGSGLITMEISGGVHQVELILGRTPVRWLGELLSLAALIVTASLLFWSRRGKLKWKKPLVTLAVIISILILSRVWPETTRADGDLSWDFPQLAYLHHDSEGIVFDDGTILNSYAYDKEEVATGEKVIITLSWNPAPSSSVSIELATPAVNRFKLAPTVAAQTINSPMGQVDFELSIPDNAPAGLYVPRLRVDGTAALTSSGNNRGDLFLRPLLVTARPDNAPADGADLEAHPVMVRMLGSDVLEVQLQWLTRVPQTINYNYSLRLIDAEGSDIARLDGQPGYGFLPSSLWSEGQWVDDWMSLSIPSELEASNPGSPYALVVRLYEVETGEVVLIQRLGEMNWRGAALKFAEIKPSFEMPETGQESDVTFEDRIKLGGYDLNVMEDTLNLVLHWQALAEGFEDYSHFVHLIDPENGQNVAQHDSMPRFDTYPTSQWSKGEVVLDQAVIDLSDIPAGIYKLAVGLYKDLGVGSGPDRFQRLTAVDGTGSRLSDDRFFLPGNVIIDR